MIAGFDSISFGFYVALNALTPVWLQTPKKAGGLYGFTISENAACKLFPICLGATIPCASLNTYRVVRILVTFIHWVGVLFGLLYGHLLSDRIPLWFVARNKGLWKPEFRLHVLWPTNLVLMPLGLGLVGIGMQYELHWAVMALGQFFVTIGSLVSIPITVNYICECFRSHTVEATLVLNSMRLFLGLSINFYISLWIDAVGIGWVYGMMAFFTVFAFCFLILLMLYGSRIRAIHLGHTSDSEAGTAVLAQREVHVD